MRSVALDRTGTSRRRIVIGLVLLTASAVAVVAGIIGKQVPAVMLGAVGGFFGVATIAPLLARPVVRAAGVLLPRLFGIRGHLARENAMRNPRRTAATASALMIGVALVGAITVFANSGKWSITTSFDKEFQGDLVLESGAWMYGGLSPELSSDLATRPEVGAVAGKQFTQAQVGDTVAEFAGWPAASVGKVFDLGVASGSVADMGTDGIALSTRYAEDNGWTMGSSVPVTFATGATRTFTVKALFDKPDFVGKAWVDRAAFTAAVPGTLDTSVYVAAADGVDMAALEAAVTDVSSAYGTAEVLDRAAMKQRVVEGFNMVLGIVYALLALAIGIALLGIANTVALSVVERTQELGLLRAVGMSRAHLRGMVRWEAALFAVFGTLTGLVVGLFLARAMVFAIANTGTAATAEFVVPVGQLLIIVVIAAACGVLAALLPARRAAKLDVLEAISTV
jgi:putative ABC transport system permease protein